MHKFGLHKHWWSNRSKQNWSMVLCKQVLHLRLASRASTKCKHVQVINVYIYDEIACTRQSASKWSSHINMAKLVAKQNWNDHTVVNIKHWQEHSKDQFTEVYSRSSYQEHFIWQEIWVGFYATCFKHIQYQCAHKQIHKKKRQGNLNCSFQMSKACVHTKSRSNQAREQQVFLISGNTSTKSIGI